MDNIQTLESQDLIRLQSTAWATPSADPYTNVDEYGLLGRCGLVV